MEKKLQKAKLLLKGQEVSDDLLNFYFELIEQKVKNYCHRDDIPEGLELIIIEMVASYALKTINEGQNGKIQSIKRGDTQITYGGPSGSTTTTIDDVIRDYKRQLFNFRKLVTR
ncbi:MAG: hypothetical protein GXZ11_05665 [Tissierellia bacterium]|nr:hypothetical protein [Tissierellia bacterium]